MIYVKDQVTVGIGTGEQDRVGVAEIARDKAYRKLADRYCFEAAPIRLQRSAGRWTRRPKSTPGWRPKRAACSGRPWSAMPSSPSGTASTSASGKGCAAVIQPGGSANDYQSIEACNEAGATMVYTGQRSFKH